MHQTKDSVQTFNYLEKPFTVRTVVSFSMSQVVYPKEELVIRPPIPGFTDACPTPETQLTKADRQRTEPQHSLGNV